ncbi:MAG: CpsD/CapB family tyrosine-protein kinase [Eubacterium coprostanoligenes]|uniref:CpsD/CapB family tyrosine-protein kinase n=1 Tax=Eubacterium coprostanoligenes TaxID=290054 RepID=UPI002352C347|nr:CpsD/CapB family tyrosine-protein kinase [Eubacterium coprostanoligenes]MCI7264092.1 CpsD/CapB family tyrosine-protein kinase [Eubacterium coprostanoligenes]
MLKFNKKSGANSIHATDSTKLLTASSTFAVKEAYNSIRTNLLFTQQGEKCPIFVVTSPTANNGKTINSANLAINFAQMGKKTLVIDADMRNPSLHKLFSLSSRNGLSEILAGLTDNITVTKTDIENLSVLTSGKIPPNPTELLSSPRMDKLLDFVKEHYDCVFIDTPPVNIVTDATVFSQKATGYVIIVKTDTTNVPELKTTVSTLQGINANILGFILNDANSEKKKYYSYYRKYSRNYSYNYKYSYGNDKK